MTKIHKDLFEEICRVVSYDFVGIDESYDDYAYEVLLKYLEEMGYGNEDQN